MSCCLLESAACWDWILKTICRLPEIKSANALKPKKAIANVVVRLRAGRGLLVLVFIIYTNLICVPVWGYQHFSTFEPSSAGRWLDQRTVHRLGKCTR